MILGGVDIGDLFIDPTAAVPVIAATAQTIDGGSVIFAQENMQGDNIDIVAYENSGWRYLTYAVVKQIHALAAAAGAEYTLILPDSSVKQVRFRHEDAPVLELTPLIQRTIYNDSDYFYGTIKLKEVR